MLKKQMNPIFALLMVFAVLLAACLQVSEGVQVEPQADATAIPDHSEHQGVDYIVTGTPLVSPQQVLEEIGGYHPEPTSTVLEVRAVDYFTGETLPIESIRKGDREVVIFHNPIITWTVEGTDDPSFWASQLREVQVTPQGCWRRHYIMDEEYGPFLPHFLFHQEGDEWVVEFYFVADFCGGEE